MNATIVNADHTLPPGDGEPPRHLAPVLVCPAAGNGQEPELFAPDEREITLGLIDLNATLLQRVYPALPPEDHALVLALGHSLSALRQRLLRPAFLSQTTNLNPKP